MKVFRVLLLLCLPAFILSPIPSYTLEYKTYRLESGHELFIPRDENKLINPWGYFHPQTILTHLDCYVDHVFGFIDLLTDVDFLESLSDEEAERLIDFVIFIVRFSAPKSRPDLAEKYELEIAELLELMYGDENNNAEYHLSISQGCQWEFFSPFCDEKPTFTLCKKKKKNWVARKWHHFTHWVDKNKAPIIAVSVVAGGAALAVITMGASAGAEFAIGGALVGLAAGDTPPPHVNKPGEVYFRGDSPEYAHPPTHSLAPNDSTAPLLSGDFHPPDQGIATIPSELIPDYEALVEEVESVKEQISEANSTFDDCTETAKEIARDFTTQQLKESMDIIIASIEENMEKPELKSAEIITPSGSGKTVSRVGAVASRVFGLATRTTTGAGTAAVGEALTNANSSLASSSDFGQRELPIDRLIEAGKEPDRKELTKAGRALAKHGDRPDSVFPKPIGTPSQINQQGQAILEQILNHPEKCISYHTHHELGEVIKIQIPGKGGAWFKKNCEMIGFLEPTTQK
ncbi:hypothetical protein [Simkania sp.]|uniref:hypothetical protein n=1 Tax=Simkania sp. TaxID=34094 RepID=UPI003B521C5C